MKELELTIGSLGELKQYERLTLDVLEDLKGATKTLSELPAGFKTEKVCLRLADGNYVNINVIVRYGDNVADALGDARRTEKVVDGTLGGGSRTISYTDYDSIYQSSIHNPDAEKVMLEKYDNGGPTSYIVKAGDEYTYFSIDDWNAIKKKYNFTDDDMFSLFNEAFLDDAINEGKTFYFSHDPVHAEGSLKRELEYLLQNGYSYDPVSMSASFDPRKIGADGLIRR